MFLLLLLVFVLWCHHRHRLSDEKNEAARDAREKKLEATVSSLQTENRNLREENKSLKQEVSETKRVPARSTSPFPQLIPLSTPPSFLAARRPVLARAKPTEPVEKKTEQIIEQSRQAPHITQPSADHAATTLEVEHEPEVETGEDADGESDESDSIVFQIEPSGIEESAVEEPGEEVDDGESDESESIVFQIEEAGNEETAVEESRDEPEADDTDDSDSVVFQIEEAGNEEIAIPSFSQHTEAPQANPQDTDMQDAPHDLPEATLQQPSYAAMPTPVYQTWTAPIITPQADYTQLQSPAQQLSSWVHEQHQSLIHNSGLEVPQMELQLPTTPEIVTEPGELNKSHENTEIAAPQPPTETTNQTPISDFEQAALFARVTVHRQDIEDKIFNLWTSADNSDHQWTATELTSDLDNFEQEISDGIITTPDQLEQRLLKHLKDFFDLEMAMNMASSHKAEEEAAAARQVAEQQAVDAQNPVIVQMDRMYTAYYHEASEKLFQYPEEDLTNDLDTIKMELITKQITTIASLEARLGQHAFRVNFTIENAQRMARGEKRVDYPWPSRREDGVTGLARSRRSDFVQGMRQNDDDVEKWFTQMLARKQNSIKSGGKHGKRPAFEMVTGRDLETFFEMKDIEVEEEAEMVVEKKSRRIAKATGARRG